MWKIKVKTWGYAKEEFMPVEFETKISGDENIVSFMKSMTNFAIHDVTFEIRKLKEKGEENGI